MAADGVAADGMVTVEGHPPLATRLGSGNDVRVGPEGGRRAWVATSGDTRWVFLDGEVYIFEVQRAGRRASASGGAGPLSAPMPASVVRVDAAPGARVRKGDTLIILEAMKMELAVRAPADGTVKAVHCKAGDLVKPGTPLVDLD
jgi:3-methylcrotonyl-CoA carboxylase alpha subunit